MSRPDRICAAGGHGRVPSGAYVAMGAGVVGIAASAFGFKETPHVRASVSKCVFDVAVQITNKGHPRPSAVDHARKKCYTL